MRTEIIVYSGADRYTLDLTDDVSVPFTFSIDDIFDLQARKTGFSKTISVPGTHNNNQAFKHIYKINSESSFDPRVKKRVVIKQDGLTIFTGSLCLENITTKILRGVEYSFYDVTIYGEAFSFLNELGTQTIKDLDFSDYDHDFDMQHIRLTWPANFSGGGITIGMPYVKVNGNYTATQTIQYTAPSVSSISFGVYDEINRVKLTFSSAHTLVAGDALYIDCDNNRLHGTHIVADVPSSTEVLLHMAYAQLTSTSSASISVEKRQWLSFGYFYPMQDNGHYHEILTSGTLLSGVVYTILSLNGSDSFTNLTKTPSTGLAVGQSVGLTFLCSDGVTPANNPIAPTNWASGSEISVYRHPTDGGVLTNKEATINKWHPMDFIPHIYVREVWQKMFELVGYQYDCDVIDTDLFRRLVIPMDMKIDVEDASGAPFETVVMNEWLPGMKLSEFFTSILNIFNLVILPDPDNTKIVRLVSRNNFYTSDTVTWKLDGEQELNIKLANNLLPKAYYFKYKDSSDFFNKDYNKDIGAIANAFDLSNPIDRTYGDYYTETGNEFDSKVNEVELFFEPTVLAGNIAGAYPNSDKAISVCYTADDLGNNISRKTANRILIAGYRGTNHSYTFTGVTAAQSNEQMNVTMGNGAGRAYAYAAHLDNVYDGTPFHDLNFGVLPGQYFGYTYSANKWAKNTIIGKHWNRYIEDISSQHTRHVTGSFKLSVSEIYSLDFQAPVRPENCDFVLKLQRISDWDLNGDGICECEFLLKNI